MKKINHLQKIINKFIKVWKKWFKNKFMKIVKIQKKIIYLNNYKKHKVNNQCKPMNKQ